MPKTPDTLPRNHVRARILPKGDGRVATGEYDPILQAFSHFKHGETVVLHESIAKARQDDGLVEIVR